MTSLCRHLSAQEIVNWVTTADGCVHTADSTVRLRRVGVGGVCIGHRCWTSLPNFTKIGLV